VGSQRLTAWAMAWPLIKRKLHRQMMIIIIIIITTHLELEVHLNDTSKFSSRSQNTYFIFITDTKALILFRKIIIFYFGNHKMSHSTLYGRMQRFFNVKAGGTYSNHCDLEG
jgi:hypothetical protein